MTMITNDMSMTAENTSLRIRRSSSGVSIYYYIARNGSTGLKNCRAKNLGGVLFFLGW